ncbi:MAG: hypothetical protein K9J16_03455 [Melioribacteraceae bacterium]|nr:hypothetical protein [Melioribacteraceae bacterium]MCF8353479.1 hypothetical protein [Melioribacteraceae bacterium]MCF8392608.1 hypothetical protein [Melioribacteraceae bacterium]MCF8418520.1 hypothetical protein [Melioribacteraceae bacterium]
MKSVFGFFTLIIFVTVLVSCEKEIIKPRETIVKYDQKEDFKILAYTSDNENDASKELQRLKRLTGDSVTINYSNKNKKHLVYIGYFENSFEAGKRGFDLFLDSLITEYKIYKNDSLVFDEFSNFNFIGKDRNRPAIYNYNLITKKAEVLWSRWGRKIISANFTEDRNNMLFVTALLYDIEGGFPLIRNVRIYRFDRLRNTVRRIDKLGKANQIYTLWENKRELKVYFNFLDSVSTSTVVQQIHKYDIDSGKTGMEEKIFELVTQGFPPPPVKSIDFIAPDSSYNFGVKQSGDSLLYYLLADYEKIQTPFYKSQGSLINLKWSRDSKYLVFTEKIDIVNDTNKHFNKRLVIVDVPDREVIRIFEKDGILNFDIHGDLLLFDAGYNENAKIIVYNYIKDSVYSEIKIEGGCGLYNIPSAENLN